MIESRLGLVVDFHTMSQYCYTCSTTGEKLKKQDLRNNTKRYEEWYQQHQPACHQNHQGSAGAMEQKGALELCSRSVDNKMQYRSVRSVLSDGDANTIKAIHTLNLYPGLTDEKRECVNHVAKCVGKGFRTTVDDAKKKGITLGDKGEGQLTEKKMTRLQKYYRKAVLSHSDVPSMKQAIWATIEHCSSTDNDPRHSHCPTGIKSHCFYQRAIAKGEPPSSHKENLSTYLNDKVVAAIKPLYERLTDGDLLRGCLLGKTQNVNESLHSVIWTKCPKHLFIRKERFDIGVSLAVAEFNMGSCGTRLSIDTIGLSQGKTATELGKRTDITRVRLAEKASSDTAKRRRTIIRNAMAAEEQRLESEEGGPQYVPGGF